MDKGYSGLNPYKSKIVNLAGKQIDNLPPKIAAMRIYESVIAIKAEDIVSEQVEKATEGHPYSKPKYAPVKIPYNADVKKQSKNGYEQVKYTWSKGQYKYEARWHTATPDSCSNQQSWVISRIKSGTKTSPRTVMIRVGSKWAPHSVWQAAITARRSGAATKAQLKLLNDGHFTRKRGKK